MRSFVCACILHILTCVGLYLAPWQRWPFALAVGITFVGLTGMYIHLYRHQHVMKRRLIDAQQREILFIDLYVNLPESEAPLETFQSCLIMLWNYGENYTGVKSALLSLRERYTSRGEILPSGILPPHSERRHLNLPSPLPPLIEIALPDMRNATRRFHFNRLMRNMHETREKRELLHFLLHESGEYFLTALQEEKSEEGALFLRDVHANAPYEQLYTLYLSPQAPYTLNISSRSRNERTITEALIREVEETLIYDPLTRFISSPQHLQDLSKHFNEEEERLCRDTYFIFENMQAFIQHYTEQFRVREGYNILSANFPPAYTSVFHAGIIQKINTLRLLMRKDISPRDMEKLVPLLLTHPRIHTYTLPRLYGEVYGEWGERILEQHTYMRIALLHGIRFLDTCIRQLDLSHTVSTASTSELKERDMLRLISSSAES